MGKGKKSPDEMTFLEHLEDLRKRIFYSLIGLFIAVVPGALFCTDIFDILSKPVTKYLPPGQKLTFTKLTVPFTLYMKVSLITALFIAMPFIFLQVWYFIAPGLYKKEKKYVWPFVAFTTIFFILGALFGFFIVFPWACRFFLQLGAKFQPIITADEYFNLILKMLLGIGAVFEMPTLIFFLARMGIVTSRWMVKNFKYAILAVFIIAAVITPTPDMINQTILALPMLALYSLSILIAFFFGKERKTRRAKKEEKRESKSGLAG